MRTSSHFSIPIILYMSMVMPRQTRSGLRQSWHLSSPVAQGVFFPMLRALSGPADVARAVNGRVEVGTELIPAGDYVHALVAEERGGQAVAHAVDVHYLSRLGYGVGRADVGVGRHGAGPGAVHVLLLPVPGDVGTHGGELIVEAYRFGRAAAAYTDGGAASSPAR